jgi:hypothetical protein
MKKISNSLIRCGLVHLRARPRSILEQSWLQAPAGNPSGSPSPRKQVFFFQAFTISFPTTAFFGAPRAFLPASAYENSFRVAW